MAKCPSRGKFQRIGNNFVKEHTCINEKAIYLEVSKPTPIREHNAL